MTKKISDQAWDDLFAEIQAMGPVSKSVVAKIPRSTSSVVMGSATGIHPEPGTFLNNEASRKSDYYRPASKDSHSPKPADI